MFKKLIILIFNYLVVLTNFYGQCPSPITSATTISTACSGNILITGAWMTVNINSAITGDITINNQGVTLVIGSGGSVSGSLIVNGQQANLNISGPIMGDVDLNNQQIAINLASDIGGALDIGDRQITINVTDNSSIGSVRAGNQLDGFNVNNNNNSESITLTILNDVCVEDQQSFFQTAPDDFINIIGTIKCTGNGCNQASFVGNVNASACVQDFGNFCASNDLNVGPLPIELLSFSLKNTSETILIQWTTISEINNDYFTVQKSNDGVHFYDLVNLPGAGNSNQIVNYQYHDKNPANGLSYYRLKQVDFDGSFKIFSPLATQFSRAITSVKVYPNPADQQITIEGSQEELATVSLYNFLGQDVTSLLTIVSSNEQSLILDLSIIDQGLYIIKTKNSSKKLYKK